MDKREDMFRNLESVLEIMAAQGKGVSRRTDMALKSKKTEKVIT